MSKLYVVYSTSTGREVDTLHDRAKAHSLASLRNMASDFETFAVREETA